jgi:hypothetical protein
MRLAEQPGNRRNSNSEKLRAFGNSGTNDEQFKEISS